MFARYFVELPMDAERVEAALMRSPETWVPGLARDANHHGDALLAEVGFGDDVRVARKVAIEFGDPVRMPSKTVMPLHWAAAGATGLFPALDADLEIAPLGPHAHPARDERALRAAARRRRPRDRPGRALPGGGGHLEGLPRSRGRGAVGEARDEDVTAGHGGVPIGHDPA